MLLPAFFLALSLAVNPEPLTLAEIGTGKAIVFSPDLSVPGNRDFYERLGFLYFDSPDWSTVLDTIGRSPRPIELVILETHGTNGSGLKLQEGKKSNAARSYVSIGGLQERLERAGVSVAVVSACNAGRLFRPEIYSVLRPDPREPLFLPATLGIVHASHDFEPGSSSVQLMRRKQSNLETLMEGRLRELSPEARVAFRTDEGDQFVVSSMLIQILLRDPSLELIGDGWEEKISRADISPAEREALFQRFLRYLDEVAAREAAFAGQQKGQAGNLSLSPAY
jgi:hypothetical protein